MVYPAELKFHLLRSQTSAVFSSDHDARQVGSSEPEDEYIPPKKKTSEYRWVVDALGVVGAVTGGILFGVPGLIVGGALLAGGGVPLRRYLAARENPKALEGDLSAGAEIGVTAGATLLFGMVFGGLARVAQVAATRISAAVATRVAVTAARRPLVRKALAHGWQPFKSWYTGTGHVALRTVAGGVMAYDLTHDRNGNWEPANFSLDTGLGFISSIYSANLVYSQVFGANMFGLDVAAPMSIATYQLIRVMAGAQATDLGNFNYNEASRFRYMNEFANIIQSTAIYGRAYLRPDLRMAIAANRGLTASMATGAQTIFPRGVSPFGWLMDGTVGAVHRATPRAFRNVVKPTVAFAAGPPQWAERFGPRIAARLTVVSGFKNNDMMKPDMGPAGRVLSLAQVWGLVVPYQMVAAPLLGMKGKEWGAHRLWKFTAWPLIGSPIQASFGGDTAVAKLVGFTVGMGMDGAITLFYNPRYEKREWAWDLRQSLAAYQNAKTEAEQEAISEYVLGKIYLRQMTDWDLKSFVAGRGLRTFNQDYLRTLREELDGYGPQEKKAWEEISRRKRSSG